MCRYGGSWENVTTEKNRRKRHVKVFGARTARAFDTENTEDTGDRPAGLEHGFSPAL